MAIDLTKEIGRRIATIIDDSRGNNIPFPTPIHIPPKGKCDLFP